MYCSKHKVEVQQCVQCEVDDLRAENAVLLKALGDIKHEMGREETPQECLDTPDQWAALEKRIYAGYDIADKCLQGVGRTK
jgi:hypothetical protein